ncbi:kinase-like protein, partial [Calocera cornea HHB12733]
REALIWSSLSHPYIVPLLGVADYAKICPGGFSQLCMVAPWMSGGNIMEYIKDHPNVSRLSWLLDIVHAVLYLHSRPSGPVIHGDLKGNNILIEMDEYGFPTAQLTDFGLAQMMDVSRQDNIATTSTAGNGNARWLAQSDIFEMMRTFLEVWPILKNILEVASRPVQILTGAPPFQGKPDYEVIVDVFQGINPERPTGNCGGLDDDRWSLMLNCWSDIRAQERPSLQQVEEDIQQSIYMEDNVVM